jgi:hypothetical protein
MPSDIFNHLNPIMDPILQRRSEEWYVGKVMLLKGDAVPVGYPEGYYIPTKWNPQGHWFDYHFIGTTLPESAKDEPVYIHDGTRRDLKAVPSTVRPSVASFLFWITAYLVVATFLTVVGIDHNPWAFFMFLPVAAVPLFAWFVDVEPVRGTKVALVLLAGQVALHYKHKRDWNRYQATNAKYRP